MPQYEHTVTDAGTGQTVVTSVPWTDETLKAWIAEIRWQHEVSGCPELNALGLPTGKMLDTSETSQAKINNCVTASLVRPDRQFAWKFKDGSVEQRNAAEVTRIGNTVVDHAQACRVRESELLDRIAAGEDLESVADDVNSGWPGQE